MSGNRAMLEAAIADQFDDLAVHAAYADLLIEEGDPRGEFVRLQVALEDDKLAAKERADLTRRESLWMARHSADYLGPLAGHAATDDENVVGFQRGWLVTLEVPVLTAEIGRQLRECPAARMLQSLTLRDLAFGTDDQDSPLHAITDAPFARSLRRLAVGVRPQGVNPNDRAPPPAPRLLPFLESLTRLETLSLWVYEPAFQRVFAMNWPHLRKLRVEFGHDIPIGVLARNDTLGELRRLEIDTDYRGLSSVGVEDVREFAAAEHLANFRHMRLRYCDDGDRLVRTLIRSGLMRRLKTLDLQHGNIGDQGVRAFVQSDCARRLSTLDLRYNRISDGGLEQLESLNCDVIAHPQSARRDERGTNDLYEEDFE